MPLHLTLIDEQGNITKPRRETVVWYYKVVGQHDYREGISNPCINMKYSRAKFFFSDAQVASIIEYLCSENKDVPTVRLFYEQNYSALFNGLTF